MTASAVDSDRHLPTSFEPAAEHQIVFVLVRSMLLDCADQGLIVGPPRENRVEHAVDRGVAAMLVVDVDRTEKVQVPAAKPITHVTILARLGRVPAEPNVCNG